MTKSHLPRKQRLAIYTAPQHKRRKWISAHLAEDLLLRYGTRSITIREGDVVKVMRGNYKGKSGRVTDVKVRSGRIVVENITYKKADGTELPRPIDPSNTLITKLNLSDARRRERLEMLAREGGSKKE